MAGTNSTVDGMGFEEVNQEVTMTAIISGTDIYAAGSITGENAQLSYIYAADTYSSVFGASTGSITQLRSTNIYNTQGQLYPVQVGSPVAYSAVVKAGSLITSAGSQGFTQFGNQFSTDKYFVTLTPTGSATGYNESYASGIKHVSGTNMVGAPSLRYDWVAVGII